MKETNIIGRQRFRIKVREEKDAELVFQRISDLMKARLPLLLDELFNDVLPTNKTIRIDQLRIDVGTLSESNLEEELTEGILSALRKQLAEITGTATPSSTELEDQGRAPTYTKPEEMEVERLQFFLLNGYYPWWSARQEASSPDDLILSVLNKSLSRFREMISQIIGKPRVRERLRQQFKAATLVAINARLSSSAWPQRYADLRLLATLYDLAPFSHQRPAVNLEKTLLVCSLNTLLSAPEDSISADQWVLTLLEDLAEFTKIPLADLSIHFSRTLQTSLRESASRFPADQVLRIRKQLPGREAASNNKLDEPNLFFTQVLNFIRSGAIPQVGLLHDKPALEKELLRLLHAGDQRFARAFWSLLQEPGLPDRIHRSLTEATLEELHRILWGPEWETVKNYLSDFDQLLQAGNTLNLRFARLRSHLLSDWMKARLTAFLPSHRKTTPRSSSRFWPSALRASFLRLAPDPELTLAKLSGPTKAYGEKPVPASSLSWKSDLPELLTSRPSDSKTEKEEPGPNPKPTGKQSVAIFRHFLEQGILPEGHAKNGLIPILKDIHRQALSGSEVLFKMLARVLRNERSFSRFRAELPLSLVYTIAYQLVHTRPADLRREDADRLPFAYPETEGLARNQEGSFSDLTPDTEANGSGPSQEGPNPAFLQLPSHLRPRPNESADQPTEPSSDLSPRQVLFLLLAELRAPDFLRHAYAFIIRQRLLEGAKPASLEQLLGEWTSELQGLTGQPLKTLNDWLKSMIPSAGPIANLLKKALQHLAKKGENALDLLRPETTETAEKTADFQHLHAAISRWADLLSGTAPGPFGGHFPEADDVELLLKKAPANRVLLANLLAGKKVIPARLRKAISGPEMQRLALLLREDLPPEAAELLKGLQAIILKSGVYGSAAEANTRMEDYLTLASWGLEAVSSDRGDAYAEKILSLIAREVGLTTIDLADRLLEENSDFPSAELQQFLGRTRAKIAPEAVKKIRQQTETKHGEAGKKTPKERRGEFYRTALLEQLKTGKTPWWEEESLAADQLFERAAKQNAKALVKLLGQNPKLAETLFPRLSTAQLEEFFVRVFPEYSGFMLAFTEALSRSGQVGSALKSKATQTAWRPAWSYVLSHQTFQTEVFVREALRTAAKDFNLKPQGLLRALSAEATARTDLHDVRYYRLAAILRELQTDLPPQQALKADQPPIAEGSANVFLGADAGAKKGPTEKQGKEGRLEDEAPATEPRAQKNTLPLEAEEKPAKYADQLSEEVGLLQHFFLYGTPPAGQSSRSRSELLTLQNRIIALHPEIAGNLYRLVLGDHIARERLIRSFPEALRASILQLLLEGKMPWVERIWADLKALLPGLLSTFDSSGFRSWALREMLAFAPLVRPRPSLSDYPEHLLSGLAEQDGLRLEQFFPKLLDAVQASPTQLREDWNKLLADLQDNKSSQAAEETDEESAKKHPPMEESLFIHNSGLVILGAYLPRYFKMLDMVANRQFRDEQAAARGVLLLEYLVSGRTEVAEHELAFNKILCGLDVPTPVPAGIVLTDEEKNVSEQMLNAIIQNWDKMNSSTVENLQGSFLIRDGLLREEEESWSLKVESKGYDVILSFLPWTISLISLPWMDKPLEVDWTTGM